MLDKLNEIAFPYILRSDFNLIRVKELRANDVTNDCRFFLAFIHTKLYDFKVEANPMKSMKNAATTFGIY